jgi:hypothetical protein
MAEVKRCGNVNVADLLELFWHLIWFCFFKYFEMRWLNWMGFLNFDVFSDVFLSFAAVWFHQFWHFLNIWAYIVAYSYFFNIIINVSFVIIIMNFDDALNYLNCFFYYCQIYCNVKINCNYFSTDQYIVYCDLIDFDIYPLIS